MSSAGMLRIPLEEAIDRALEKVSQSENRRGYIGASWIGQECERAAWYDFIWASPNAFHGRTLRRFETGHVYEPRVIGWLESAGYDVIAENPNAKNKKGQYGAEALGGLLRGHVDGFVRGTPDNGPELDQWHLLEIKAMASAKYHYDEKDVDYNHPLGNRHPTEHPTAAGNEANIEGRWWRYRKKGVRKSDQMYYSQLQTYMGVSRLDHSSGVPNWEYWGLDAPLSRALFLAVNTDTEQIHAEIVEYEPVWFQAALMRAKRIAKDRRDGPKRKRETPLYPPCRFCDHVGICHGNDAMAANCRTCEHAEVKIPGDQGFYGTRAQWMCSLHGRGCGDCTACEQYSPIIEVVEF